MSSAKPPQLPRLRAFLRNRSSRRHFVQVSTLCALAAACRAEGPGGSELREAVDAGAALPTFATIGAGQRVVVLGGGLSGLACAHELARAGFDVRVLERQNRVGGRVVTLRGFFADDLYAELGATRIPSHHHLPRGYCQRFGLTVEPMPETETAAVYELYGERWVLRSGGAESGTALPGAWAFTDLERAAGLAWIKAEYTKMAFPDLGDPRQAGWPDAAMRKYDEMSFAQYLRSKGASDAAIAVIRATNGSEIDTFSALAWLGCEILDAAWEKTGKIQGGNDQLAEKFAADLGERLTLSAWVKRVASDERGVRVTFQDRAGALEELRADFLVCTLAPPLLAELSWEPGLSLLKAEAAKAARMQPVTRVNLQFRSRFWNVREKLRGLQVAHTDLGIERLWDMTATQPGERGILTSYVQAELAMKASAVPPSSRSDWALAQVESVFPGAKQEFEKGMAWAWHEQPWVKGGWYALKPGQIDQYLALRRSEGRLFFAGDHTTLQAGWMQGALEAAHRVVNEIVVKASGPWAEEKKTG